jgi:hypothetical protein
MKHGEEGPGELHLQTTSGISFIDHPQHGGPKRFIDNIIVFSSKPEPLNSVSMNCTPNTNAKV